MKKILLLASVSLISLHSALADWVVVQKVNAEGKEQNMSLKAKGDLARMDVGTDMSLILDTKTGDATMFMHAQKMLMKLTADSIKGMMAMAAGQLGNEPAAKPQATGTQEKVGTYDCEVFTWSSKIGTGKFWVAKDFPDAKSLNEIQDKMMSSAGNPMAAILPQNKDFPGVVVKSDMEIMGKKTVSELVSAKQEDVPADVFKTPEGYQEMKMPAMPTK